jgi:PHD/YefM family antitoxin component YafN of YafNO toxin-antitoxin module
MIRVPSTEFAKNFGKYREVALRTPVAVTSHDRVTGYFVSADEYEAYIQLKNRLPKTFAVEDLSEDTIRAIAAAKMAPRHDSLNALLDD